MHWYPGTLHPHNTEKEYLLVITNRYSKMIKTLPMNGISAGEVSKCFRNTCVLHYGSPFELVCNNGGCFRSMYFQDVCGIMSIQNNITTTYHLQKNGRAERYHFTIQFALLTYVAEQPRDLDLYTYVLAYAYTCQPHKSPIVPTFQLVLSKQPEPLALRTILTIE